MYSSTVYGVQSSSSFSTLSLSLLHTHTLSLSLSLSLFSHRYGENSLQTFYKLFCKGKFKCGEDNNATAVTCKGDACAGSGGTESMLDIEYITAMGAGVKTEFWGFSGNNPYSKQNEPFLKWLYTVGNTSDADVPKLFSTSYGEDETLIPTNWQDRTNVEFQKVCGTSVCCLCLRVP